MASEERRLEAEDARRAAVDSLRETAGGLASTLERMTAIEDMRRSVRDLRDTTKRDAKLAQFTGHGTGTTPFRLGPRGVHVPDAT